MSVSAVDDGWKFTGFQSFYRGSLKFSVPAGTFAAWSLFSVPLPGGGFGTAQVELAQFTLTGNGTVTVDARTATASPSAKPPTAANLDYYEASTTRVAAGPDLGGFFPSNSISMVSNSREHLREPHHPPG